MGAGDQQHHNHVVELGVRRLTLAVGVNLLLTVVQVVAGILSGSLSLIADALHNFGDAAGLVLALVARRIASRPADAKRTFGYGRAEIVGGLINLTAIMVIAGYLVLEAVGRAFERPEIDGWIVIVVAAFALLVDVATAMLTHALSKNSVNMRAAFLHNVADALASVAVIVSGVLIVLFEWFWTDLVATVGIGVYIVWMSWPPMKRCMRILMQSTPEGMSLDAVARTIESVEGVAWAAHIHLWPIDESMVSLEARIGVNADLPVAECQHVVERVRAALKAAHGIEHVTLEACGAVRPDAAVIERH